MRRAAVGHGADDPAAGTDAARIAHRAVPAHVDVTYDAMAISGGMEFPACAGLCQ